MLKALLSIRFRAILALLTGQSKKRSRGKLVLMVFLYIYLFAVFGMLFGMQFTVLADFRKMGLDWFYFALYILFSLAVSLFGTVFMTKSQLFDAKDNELLISLPIAPRTILLSRMVPLFLMNLFFQLTVTLPAGWVWLHTGGFPAGGLLSFVLLSLALPFTSMALSCLLAWLIALLFSRIRHQQIITAVFSLGFFGLYMWGIQNLQQYLLALVQKGPEIARAAGKVFPLYWAGLAMGQGYLPALLGALLCLVLPFGLMYGILSRSFLKIATARRGTPRIAYRKQTLKGSSVCRALVQRELRRLFSSSNYLLNCGMGLVMLLFGAGFLCFKGKHLLYSLEAMGLAQQPMLVTAFLSSLICFMSTTAYFSAPSLSLEGRSLWCIRSLPVTGRQVLEAKLLMHLLCALPIQLIAALAAGLALERPLHELPVLLGITALFSLWVGLLGLIANLHFPRFDWENEAQPVKQGASVGVTMFGSTLPLLACALPWFFLFKLEQPALYLAALAGLLTVLDGLLYHRLVTWGAKKFDSL